MIKYTHQKQKTEPKLMKSLIEEEKVVDEDNGSTEKIDLQFPMEEDLNVVGTLTRTIIPKTDHKEYLINIELNLSKDEEIELHWGLFQYPRISKWVTPPEEYYPKEETIPFDKLSANTNFINQEITFKLKLLSTDKDLYHGINFVFHNLNNERWYNNNGGNYRIILIPPEKKKKSKTKKNEIIAPDYIEDAIDCEATAENWCLMLRYQKVRDSIFQLDLDDPNECIWIYIWLRYSFKKLLDWQRNYNTTPRELQWSLRRLTFEITKSISEMLKKERKDNQFTIPPSVLLRESLMMCGKGKNDGQIIRDEILNIMHRHRLEHFSFYEQWHQKLHNNTTPEDIVICEGLVNFLRTNDIDEYRNTLEKGGITKERLLSFERKIELEPYYAPECLPDFEKFLGVLKDVLCSADLVTMYEQAKYAFGENEDVFNEIIEYKDDWDTIKQIWRVTNGRECLHGLIHESLDDIEKLKDLLFFDGALVIYLRQIIEKIIHIDLDFPLYVNEITALIKNILYTYDNYPEIKICLEDWINFAESSKEEVKNGNKDAAMKVKSVSDRLGRLLGHVIDYYNTEFGPRATYFGNGCKIDPYYVNLFTEEEIRGSIFFALSMLLNKIEPILREKANLGNWLIISRAENQITTGKLRFEKNLEKVQLEKFEEKTFLIVENIGGNEEIPLNCVGVIIVNSNNYPDMLAHVSVRARNLKVPLIVSFSSEDGTELSEAAGKFIELSMSGENISYKINDYETYSEIFQTKEIKEKVEPIEISKDFIGTFIEIKDFTNDRVGAKSINTKRVYNRLPDWIHYPESFAIPFNVYDYILNLPDNSEMKDKINAAIKKISKVKNSDLKKIKPLLKKAAKFTLGIIFPKNNPEVQKLRKRLKLFGVEKADLKKAFKAIKEVWASKYNERAFIACTKVGIKITDIYMAVLCQKIIPAEYAFVIHTKNPSTNDPNEIYSEVVYGMGETLVGFYEGHSFSFTYNKNNRNITIKSYPNKSIALKNSGFIFRSDSNTEDLEGFAGAGLFDSVPMTENEVINMGYKENDIFLDSGFVKKLCEKIAELGIETEKYFNWEPQDIEGVYYKEQFYIVQTRPQV